nr:hypothetical protein [Tanacetum cinerariifolium]
MSVSENKLQEVITGSERVNDANVPIGTLVPIPMCNQKKREAVFTSSSSNFRGGFKNNCALDSSDDNKGPSIPKVPVEGPSIQRLLNWYGYNTIEKYLSDNYFPSTYKDTTTDKDNIDEDAIQECYSAKSKGKYVPVSKKHNPKVKSPIPVKRCVLGLANINKLEDSLKKFRVRKQKNYANKAKGKRKVSGGDTQTAACVSHPDNGKNSKMQHNDQS